MPTACQGRQLLVVVLLLASPGLSQQACSKVNDTLLKEKRIEAFTVQVLSKLGYTGTKPPNPSTTVEYSDIDLEIRRLYHKAEAVVHRHNSHCPVLGDLSNFDAQTVQSFSGSEGNDISPHVLLPHAPHLTSAHSSRLSHLPRLTPTSLTSLTPPHTSLIPHHTSLPPHYTSFLPHTPFADVSLLHTSLNLT